MVLKNVPRRCKIIPFWHFPGGWNLHNRQIQFTYKPDPDKRKIPGDHDYRFQMLDDSLLGPSRQIFQVTDNHFNKNICLVLMRIDCTHLNPGADISFIILEKEEKKKLDFFLNTRITPLLPPLVYSLTTVLGLSKSSSPHFLIERRPFPIFENEQHGACVVRWVLPCFLGVSV